MSTIDEIHPDYTSALAACGDGYSDADIAEVVAYKAVRSLDGALGLPEQALNTIIALGIATDGIPSRPLSVLDFGGGCGFHYFQSERVFGPMRWTIVESAAMASRAAQVGAGKFSSFSEVRSALAWLGKPDIVHTSGTLQCVPDPIASLRELLEIQAPHFMLARYPLWKGPITVGIQNSYLSDNGIGPMPPEISDRNVRYPNTFVDFSIVDSIIASYDYELLFSTRSPSADYMVAGTPALGRTFFFRHRKLQNS